MKKRLILFTLITLIGGILYVPFVQSSSESSSIEVWFIFPIASAAAVLLFSWLGFKFADKSDLEMPLLMKWESSQHLVKSDFRILYVPIILSMLFALVTFGLNQLFDAPENPGNFWIRILTAPWAGMVTETISHLFVMSGIYLLIKHRWASILLSSLIFLILFHLNSLEGALGLTIYLGAMNFAGATLTGWFYSKYGLESAIIGHTVMHLIILGLN